MHVNETIRNESKTCIKIKGGTYKISIISAANCHRVLNLEQHLCSDINLWTYMQIIKFECS